METVSYQNDSKSVLVRATPATPTVAAPPTGTAAEGGGSIDDGQCHSSPPTDKDDQLPGALVRVCACPHHFIRPYEVPSRQPLFTF